MMRMNPVTAALDADEDGEISAAEIENAATALKALDEDKNGKLSGEELRPNFRRIGGRTDGPGGPGGLGRGFGRRATPEETVARWMEFDKNKDGKLDKEELPERIQGVLARADADKDGFATKEELAKIAEQESGPEGPGPGGPGRFGGGRGFGGFDNPQAFIDRMFELDADKDGKLTREELSKMTEQFGRGFGRGDRPERPRRPD